MTKNPKYQTAKEDSSAQGAWNECPSGSLIGFAKSDRRRRFNAAAKRVAVPAVSTGLLLVAAWIGLSSIKSGSNNQPPGGLACRQVISHQVAYFENSIEEVLLEQIDSHLARCPKCRDHYRDFAQDLGAEFNVVFAPPQHSSFPVVASIVPLLGSGTQYH